MLIFSLLLIYWTAKIAVDALCYIGASKKHKNNPIQAKKILFLLKFIFSVGTTKKILHLENGKQQQHIRATLLRNFVAKTNRMDN
jgi:hypothetical protein